MDLIINYFKTIIPNYIKSPTFYISRKVPEHVYFEAYLIFSYNSIFYSRYHYKLDNGTIIYGKQLNNKVNRWRKLGIFDDIDNHFRITYTSNNKTYNLKYLSTDTQFICNKLANHNNVGRNKYYKGKNGIKLSTLVDRTGISIASNFHKGNCYDSKLYLPLLEKSEQIIEADKYKNSKKFKRNLLADSGYDDEKIRDLNRQKNIRSIIPYNKRNTKKKELLKKKKLNQIEKRIIKHRHIVENSYSWKNWVPRLMYVFDKNIDNWLNLFRLNEIRLILMRQK